MDKKEIKKITRKILRNSDHGVKIPSDFPDEASLFLSGILDSFGIFTFIQTLQKEFNLVIKNKEIHPGNFETIEQITTFIFNKMEVGK